MNHLTAEELSRWREVGSENDRVRITTHLAECATCAETYAELVRQASPETSAPQFDAADFVSAGYRARSRATHGRRVKWWIPAAAAAAIAIGVLTPYLADSIRNDAGDSAGPTDGGPTQRGASLTPLGPSGLVEIPFTFEWQNGREDATYLVEIYDDERALVFSKKLSQSRLDSTELGSVLTPGNRYRWMVSVIDSGGNPIATSPLTRFQLAQP